MALQKHVLVLDSRDRMYDAYPTPSEYRVMLPKRYSNVVEARLVSAEIPSTFYVFGPGKTDVSVTLHRPGVGDTTHLVSIPTANYTLTTMEKTLKNALDTAFDVDFTVVIDRTTYKATVGPTDEAYSMTLDATVGAGPSATDWGLAYYLGFDKTVVTGPVVTSTRVVSLNPQTYILLDISELNGVDESSMYGEEVGFGCFAKIPFAVNSFEYMYLDTSRCTDLPVKLNPSIPRLDRLHIKWRFHDGTPIDFHGVEHSLTLEFTTRTEIVETYTPPPPNVTQEKSPPRVHSPSTKVQKKNTTLYVAVLVVVLGALVYAASLL